MKCGSTFDSAFELEYWIRDVGFPQHKSVLRSRSQNILNPDCGGILKQPQPLRCYQLGFTGCYHANTVPLSPYQLGFTGCYHANTAPLSPYQLGFTGCYHANTVPLSPYQLGFTGCYHANTVPLSPYQLGLTGRDGVGEDDVQSIERRLRP